MQVGFALPALVCSYIAMMSEIDDHVSFELAAVSIPVAIASARESGVEFADVICIPCWRENEPRVLGSMFEHLL